MNSCVNIQLTVRGYKVLTTCISGKMIGFFMLAFLMAPSVYAMDSLKSLVEMTGRLSSSMAPIPPKRCVDRHYEEIRQDLKRLDREDNVLNGRFAKTGGVDPAEWIIADLAKLDEEDLLLNRPIFVQNKGNYSLYYRQESKFPYPENSSDR